MTKETQWIDQCVYCGHLFEDGESYWKINRRECFCENDSCYNNYIKDQEQEQEDEEEL